MLPCEAVRYRDQSAIWLLNERCQCGLDVRIVQYRHGDRFNCKGRRGPMHRAQKQSGKRRRLRIVDYGYPCDPWVDLLEQLQPFTPDRSLKIGEARNIPARSCEALHKPLLDGLGDIDENDRNGRGLPLERDDRWRGASDQHIRPPPDQFLREGLDAIDVAARPTKLDIDIPSLDPSELREPLPKCHDIGRAARILLYDVHHHPDVPHSVALLRARRERPHSRAPEPCDELAPSCMTRKEHCER